MLWPQPDALNLSDIFLLLLLEAARNQVTVLLEQGNRGAPVVVRRFSSLHVLVRTV